MSATESKEDFLTFRGLLNLMECLLDVRGKFFGSDYQVEKPIEEVIIYTAKRLTDLDVNTSESNAFEELERLATMEQNILSQYRDRGCGYEKLRDRDIFHSVIDSKIDFIKKGSFSRLASGGGVGQLGALERLAEVKKKLWRSESMSELLISKTKEVVYTLEPKALARSSTVNLAKVMASPSNASEEQETPKRDLSNAGGESKTTAKFATSPLSWLQDQDEVYASDAKDDDDSTEDGGALTPTSTIMSGKPGY